MDRSRFSHALEKSTTSWSPNNNFIIMPCYYTFYHLKFNKSAKLLRKKRCYFEKWFLTFCGFFSWKKIHRMQKIDFQIKSQCSWNLPDCCFWEENNNFLKNIIFLHCFHWNHRAYITKNIKCGIIISWHARFTRFSDSAAMLTIK